jgi:hypothetical protein
MDGDAIAPFTQRKVLEVRQTVSTPIGLIAAGCT